MIPVYFCQENHYAIDLTSDEMISKIEVFTNNKLDTFHLNESTRTEWPQMIEEYWDEENAPTQVPFIYVNSGCFNIITNSQYINLLKALTSCGSQKTPD